MHVAFVREISHVGLPAEIARSPLQARIDTGVTGHGECVAFVAETFADTHNPEPCRCRFIDQGKVAIRGNCATKFGHIGR